MECEFGLYAVEHLRLLSPEDFCEVLAVPVHAALRHESLLPIEMIEHGICLDITAVDEHRSDDITERMRRCGYVMIFSSSETAFGLLCIHGAVTLYGHSIHAQ